MYNNNNNYMRKRADESFGAAFKPGVANVTTGLVTGILGGYLGNRYAGTKGMIAGGLGGGALGYTGASAIQGIVDRIAAKRQLARLHNLQRWQAEQEELNNRLEKERPANDAAEIERYATSGAQELEIPTDYPTR